MSDNNTEIKLTLEAWADIVIKIWESKIIKRNIGNSGQLLNSFMYHVVSNSNGDPLRIAFAFLHYGRFVDMGVGNGVNAENVDSYRLAGLSKRKKKPWFSAVFDYQVDKLTVLLQEKYSLKLSAAIVNSLDD